MTKRKTTEEFIEEARRVHGDKYDYSKVEYVHSKKKVKIICPIHGEFEQIPNGHILGRGCSRCGDEYRGEKRKLGIEEFIRKAKEVHGDKYDYSKVEYVNISTNVKIICPIHGEFWQTPSTHIHFGCGCPKCSGKFRKDTDYFIKEAILIHGDKYDYSKVEYINKDTKVCIICPKHGEFWQAPHDHLNGNGCPICKESKLEINIRNALTTENILFESQYTEDWLRNNITNRPMFIDFYLQEHKVAVECQGGQHFEERDFFGGADGLMRTQGRDKQKKNLCKEHGIELVYFLEPRYNEYMKEDDIYFNKTEDLLQYLALKDLSS